jgi:hypothetical protein
LRIFQGRAVGQLPGHDVGGFPSRFARLLRSLLGAVRGNRCDYLLFVAAVADQLEDGVREAQRPAWQRAGVIADDYAPQVGCGDSRQRILNLPTPLRRPSRSSGVSSSRPRASLNSDRSRVASSGESSKLHVASVSTTSAKLGARAPVSQRPIVDWAHLG